MKNFLKSHDGFDLSNFSSTLERIQTQLRELRDDNVTMSKDLRTIVKGIALMVSAPEPEGDSN